MRREGLLDYEWKESEAEATRKQILRADRAKAGSSCAKRSSCGAEIDGTVKKLGQKMRRRISLPLNKVIAINLDGTAYPTRRRRLRCPARLSGDRDRAAAEATPDARAPLGHRAGDSGEVPRASGAITRRWSSRRKWPLSWRRWDRLRRTRAKRRRLARAVGPSSSESGYGTAGGEERAASA